MRTSRRVAFAGGSGFQLAGIVDEPRGPSKGVVLFTHCFTCNKDLKAIVRISRGLAELDYTVLRYDLTGLGGSGGDFSQTNFNTNQADLLAACDFLASELEPPSFLIGHSFGAACSLSLAQQIDSVRGVVSIAGPSDTLHLADILHNLDAEIAATGTGSVTIGGRSFVIRQQMLSNLRSQDLPATLRQLSKPVLLFHSPVDETLGFEHVLRLFGFLTQRTGYDPDPAPTSLVTIPEADHLLARNPADLAFVTSTIAVWFERHRQPIGTQPGPPLM